MDTSRGCASHHSKEHSPSQIVVARTSDSWGDSYVPCDLQAIIGISLILIISVILYLKLDIIRIDEMREILSSTLPKNMAEPICNNVERLRRFLR